jgi:hypothetical protein
MKIMFLKQQEQWKKGDDCDYLGLIKMYFIPDDPAAFGGKIAYICK